MESIFLPYGDNHQNVPMFKRRELAVQTTLPEPHPRPTPYRHTHPHMLFVINQCLNVLTDILLTQSTLHNVWL